MGLGDVSFVRYLPMSVKVSVDLCADICVVTVQTVHTRTPSAGDAFPCQHSNVLPQCTEFLT